MLDKHSAGGSRDVDAATYARYIVFERYVILIESPTTQVPNA
jgi:hypothetical protein